MTMFSTTFSISIDAMFRMRCRSSYCLSKKFSMLVCLTIFGIDFSFNTGEDIAHGVGGSSSSELYVSVRGVSMFLTAVVSLRMVSKRSGDEILVSLLFLAIFVGQPSLYDSSSESINELVRFTAVLMATSRDFCSSITVTSSTMATSSMAFLCFSSSILASYISYNSISSLFMLLNRECGRDVDVLLSGDPSSHLAKVPGEEWTSAATELDVDILHSSLSFSVSDVATHVCRFNAVTRFLVDVDGTFSRSGSSSGTILLINREYFCFL